MNFYKECFSISVEIILTIFIIIFGYIIWNNINQDNYKIAQYYDNIKSIEMYIEEPNKDSEILYLHNIGKTKNNTNLIFKLNEKRVDYKDSMSIKFGDNIYKLSELDYVIKNKDYYFILRNIEFEAYETKKYNFCIIMDNKKSNIINIADYELLTEI